LPRRRALQVHHIDRRLNIDSDAEGTRQIYGKRPSLSIAQELPQNMEAQGVDTGFSHASTWQPKFTGHFVP
jgi:hypothetical protein